MKRLAALVRRWDIDPQVGPDSVFSTQIAALNMRRVELLALLAIVNDVIAIWLDRMTPLMMWEIPLAIVVMLVARVVERRGGERAQRATVIAILLITLLFTQLQNIDLAAQGYMTSGYHIRVLSLALLFVLPPRVLGAILWAVLPVFAIEQAVLLPNVPFRVALLVHAAIVTLIAQLAGGMIYSARRRDHEQKMTIAMQNAQLEARNADLDQLMAITAHDLRSPLYGLRNLLDLAVRRAPDEPDLPPRVMKEAIYSLDAMLALVSRLLEAHAAEHAPLEEMVEQDVRRCMLAAARRAGPQAEAAGVRITLDLPGHPLLARFDGGALAQILDNLIGNGIRFSPAGGALSVQAEGAGDRVRIAVSDAGPGIAPGDRPRLFQKFGSLARDRSGGKAASGFGLFIARTLAERIGARLAYAGGATGGSVFTIDLPWHGRDDRP